MKRKNIILAILICCFINPVLAEKINIKINESGQKQKSIKMLDPVTYDEKTNDKNIEKKQFTTYEYLTPEEQEEFDFWQKIKTRSLISKDILKINKSFTEKSPFLKTMDPPVFKRDYTLEQLENPDKFSQKCNISQDKFDKKSSEFKGIGNKTGVEVFSLQASKSKIPYKRKELMSKTWDFIKGEKGDNALLLGMFSHHTSDNEHNETHNLLGIDYKGYSVGTFKNSFSDQTVYAAIHRKIYEKQLTKDIKFDIKYKLGLMYGYQDHYPDVFGITPIIMPMFGLTMWKLGMDFIAVPDDHPTLSVNFRFNLPNNNKTVLKKAEQ